MNVREQMLCQKNDIEDYGGQQQQSVSWQWTDAGCSSVSPHASFIMMMICSLVMV
jgi:hypothetical protein